MAPKGKSPRKAAAAPAIEPGGDGDSWLGQQANQINIFNLFLTTTDDADFKQKLGERRTFTELGEDILCVNRTHELWAGFVGHGYIIPKPHKNHGSKLGRKTAGAVFGGIINQINALCCIKNTGDAGNARGGSARTGGGARSQPQLSSPPTRARARQCVLAHCLPPPPDS